MCNVENVCLPVGFVVVVAAVVGGRIEDNGQNLKKKKQSNGTF